MTGENNLDVLLKTMKPKLHIGEYVFCTVVESFPIDFADVILFLKKRKETRLF